MKRILFFLLSFPLATSAQKKLSQLPLTSVGSSVSLVGLKDTLGIFTDSRFSIASLKTYINTGLSVNAKPLDSVLAAGNTTTQAILINSGIGTHQRVATVTSGIVSTQDTSGATGTGMQTSVNGSSQSFYFINNSFLGRIRVGTLANSTDWMMPVSVLGTVNIAALDIAQTWTGVQGFSSGRFKLNGATSGSLSMNTATTTSSYTITWPAAQGIANSRLLNNGSGGLLWVTAVSQTPFTSQTSVTVNHGLGFYPLVQVIDNTGLVITPNTITHTSTNSFTVTFLVATTGTILHND